MADLILAPIPGIQSKHAIRTESVQLIRLHLILTAIIVAILHVLNEPMVNVVGLTPMGHTVFNLNYDGDKIAYKSLIKRKKLRPEYMLMDIQWMLYPLEVLDDHLKTVTGSIVEENNQRMITLGDDLIISIVPSQNVIHYKHHVHDYSYVLEDLDE